MAWDTSDRRSRLPADWHKRRLRVLRRDGYRCQHRDDERAPKCNALASDVDHVVRGDDHNEGNLQSLCRDHHRAKTSAEATEARRAIARSRRAPTERHPGLL